MLNIFVYPPVNSAVKKSWEQPHNQAECDNGFMIDDIVHIREKITFSTVQVHKPEILNLESEMTNDGSTPIPDSECGFSMASWF